MGPSAEVPNRFVEATLAFVNAGGTDQLKNLIVARRSDLLTDEADRVLAQMIESHRDNKEDLDHLRVRRALLLRCREEGIEEAFSPRGLDPEREQVAMTFINSHNAADLKRFVEEHEKEVLSENTDRVIRHLSIHYRDDERIQQMLRQKRDLMEACRRHGIAKAFAHDVMEAPRELVEALGAYLMAGPVQQVRQILQEKQTLLLTQEAEDLLAFMASAAGAGGDAKAPLMQMRLDLLHRCRGSGIDAAFGLVGIEGLLGTSLQATDSAEVIDSATESSLDEELQKVVGARGAVEEEDLRTIVERRPELKELVRNRLLQGTMFWSPAVDRSGLAQVVEGLGAAQSSGEWSTVIPLATEALGKITRHASPEMWAATQASLGTALSRTPHGDRAENLDKAIEHHELAREVLKPDVPEEARRHMWAMNEHHLALAYFQRVRGDHAENVEKAISIWRNLIITVPKEEAGLEWSTSLGDALRQRVLGNRARNLEEAIVILKDTAARADDCGDTYSGSRAKTTLGLAYITRLQGDPADNIEQGIEYITLGLREIHFDGDVGSWANVQRSLANAYTLRKLGDPSGNWRAAMDLLQQVTQRCPKDRFPEQWAENQLAMASLEMNHPDGRTRARTLEGIQIMESALEVYTLRDFPDRCAKVHANLGSVYSTLFAASEEEGYFEKAVTHVESAFRVYTRENAPERWALLHKTLGALYLRRAELGKSSDRPVFAEKAILHYERALEAAVAADDQEERLDVLEKLSVLLFRDQQWQPALHRFVDAMRASDQLLAFAHTEAGQLSGVQHSDWLYGPAAYCLFRLNDPKASMVCLEWGKSRILAHALAVRDLDIAYLPAEEFERIQSLRHQVRGLQSELRERTGEPGSHAEAGRSLYVARRNLDAEIARVRASNPAFLRSRLNTEEIYDAVEAPGALVIPLITDEGAAIYVLIKDQKGQIQFIHCSLDWLRRSLVAHVLSGTTEQPGWLRQYRAWHKGSGTAAAWRAATRSGLASMWKYMMQLVFMTLETRLEKGSAITIIPPGELSFFPFHVASEDGSGRGSLLDRYVVAYSPSVYALRASQRRSSERGAFSTTFVAAVNPTGDLPYASAETEPLEQMIPPGSLRVFREESANRENLREAMRSGTHFHFACHGIYDSDDIMRSGLALSDSTMTMAEILGPEIELSRARLVTLSACETGLIDVHYSPDEFIGLPAAFLEGGACGVVSTLWPVMDRATALLMGRFYEGHLQQKLAPASALRRAQLWLRDATREEIAGIYRSRQIRTDDTHAAYLEMTLGGPPDQRPYEDPYYWSAFQFTGA